MEKKPISVSKIQISLLRMFFWHVHAMHWYLSACKQALLIGFELSYILCELGLLFVVKFYLLTKHKVGKQCDAVDNEVTFYSFWL